MKIKKGEYWLVNFKDKLHGYSGIVYVNKVKPYGIYYDENEKIPDDTNGYFCVLSKSLDKCTCQFPKSLFCSFDFVKQVKKRDFLKERKLFLLNEAKKIKVNLFK